MRGAGRACVGRGRGDRGAGSWEEASLLIGWQERIRVCASDVALDRRGSRWKSVVCQGYERDERWDGTHALSPAEL